MKRASSGLFLIGLVLVALCVEGRGRAATERPGPLVGKAAPQFHVEGIFGESYSLETFKGHILVMQFGTSW